MTDDINVIDRMVDLINESHKHGLVYFFLGSLISADTCTCLERCKECLEICEDFMTALDDPRCTVDKDSKKEYKEHIQRGINDILKPEIKAYEKEEGN